MISPSTLRASWNDFRASLFFGYFQQLNTEVASLHQRRSESIRGRIEHLHDTWAGAYDSPGTISRRELIAYGLALGRLAESYSYHGLAENVLTTIADDVNQSAEEIENPAGILITAGELKRRRGELDAAEMRFKQAESLLEKDLSIVIKRTQSHRELGRVYYEFAYLDRLRGDSGGARAAAERSEVECEIGADLVGVEIAKSLNAAMMYEEGDAGAAIDAYKGCLDRLRSMVLDPELEKAGRTGFARRWIANAEIHLGQAYLAADDFAHARELIEGRLAAADTEPSGIGFATIKRIEAQLRLGFGDLDAAENAISTSWKTIRDWGSVDNAELAAGTITIAGVIHALRGRIHDARSCFEEACCLPPHLHNRRAQGWAWAGRSILAANAGEISLSQHAVLEGLKCVERCGAPVRAFLLELLRYNYNTPPVVIGHLQRLVCRYG